MISYQRLLHKINGIKFGVWKTRNDKSDKDKINLRPISVYQKIRWQIKYLESSNMQLLGILKVGEIIWLQQRYWTEIRASNNF